MAKSDEDIAVCIKIADVIIELIRTNSISLFNSAHYVARSFLPEFGYFDKKYVFVCLQRAGIIVPDKKERFYAVSPDLQDIDLEAVFRWPRLLRRAA